MNVIEKLINTLNTLGFPVEEQGSLQEGEPIPENYITFYNYETTPRYYSSKVIAYEWTISVFYYSNDPLKIYDVTRQIENLLLENDFLIGSNSPINSGVVGVHGREIEIQFIEKIK